MRETSIHGELRVLILSPVSENRQLIRQAISQEPYLGSFITDCEDFVTAQAVVKERDFDLIVVDTSVSETQWLVENSDAAAVVYLAHDSESPSLQDVMAVGATDYFSKDEYRQDPSILWLALRQAIRYQSVLDSKSHLAKIVHERDAMIANLSQRLWRSAPYDFRTGWFSHREVIDRLREELSRAERYKLPLSLILGDLNGISELERSMGEAFVDSALAQVSARTRSLCRQTDLVGHYGNDAFLVLLTNTDGNGARRFCQRLNESFEQPLMVGKEQTILRFIFGIVTHALDGQRTVSQLLHEAEERLEQARKEEPPAGFIAD